MRKENEEKVDVIEREATINRHKTMKRLLELLFVEIIRTATKKKETITKEI